MPIIEIFPDPNPPIPTESRLRLSFDILPDGYNDLARELWLPRLKVDGVEVQIDRDDPCRLNKGETGIGQTLSLTILKITDKDLFTPAVSIDFGIGRLIDGAWDEATFKTLLTNAVFQSLNYTIEGPPNNPADKVIVNIIDKTGNKLNKTSPTGLIVYDSDRVEINDDDVTTLYDKDGNAYTPERIAIPGLLLSDLFQEIFVNRCGFSDYETDLPHRDWPIEKYEVRFGQRFYDGLKGFIGCYRPAIKEVNDVLLINDSTVPQPSGFPPTKVLSPDRMLSFSLTNEPQKLDALMVQFVGLKNNYDFTTFDFRYPSQAKLGVGIDLEQIMVQFRKTTSPTSNVIVREDLNIENKKTYNFGDLIEDASEVIEFDEFGRPRHIRQTVDALLPNIEIDLTVPVYSGTFQGTIVVTQLVVTEDDPSIQRAYEQGTDVQYARHPFKPQQNYVRYRVSSSYGKILVDTINSLANGDPFIRDALQHQRSGNAVPGQYAIEGKIRYREELYTPLRNGNTQVQIFEVDQVSGHPLIDDKSERAGEIGMNARATTQLEMPVFAEDNPTRTLDRTDDLPVGELPAQFFLPLAKRILIQRQTSSGSAGIPYLGYDEALDVGTPVAPPDRNGNVQGNFLITNQAIEISRNGLVMNLTCRQMAESTEPLQRLPSYGRTIDEGEELIFTLPIECLDGYKLFINPGTLPHLSIEARHVETPEAAWTNLGDLDLSPWDGTTEDFEIRITAGAVLSITHETVDLITDLVS